MDDSGRLRAEHVQEDLKAHGRRCSVHKRVGKMLLLNCPRTSHPSKRLKGYARLGYLLNTQKKNEKEKIKFLSL